MKYNCPIYRKLQPWVYWTFPRLSRQRYFAKYLCLVNYLVALVALWLHLVALWFASGGAFLVEKVFLCCTVLLFVASCFSLLASGAIWCGHVELLDAAMWTRR